VWSPEGGATILLLVDLSFSATTGTAREGGRPWNGLGHDFPGLVRGVERGLLPRLRLDDRLMVGAFAGRRIWFSTPASDRASQSLAVKSALDLKAVDSVDWFGPSPIWDAIVRGTEGLADHPGVRAVILVTDGHATGNRLSASEAGEIAIDRTVQVHVVYEKGVMPPKSPPLPFATGDVQLRSLAQRTGGLFRADERHTQASWREPVPPFSEIVEAIHHTYTLTLKPPEHDEEGGSLMVRVKQPGLRVYAPASLAGSTPR
jgi:hypothetical protein